MTTRERRLEVTVDHALCVGNAACLAIAPGVFAHDANRQSVVIDPTAQPAALILEAAETCPVGAIRVRALEE